MTSLKTIQADKFYRVADAMYFCCDSTMFRHYCVACDEFMGCYFCEFDYTKKHDCEEQ
jgi:hypothetical protein